MLTVHRAPLAESYLLIVASERQAADPTALARALHRAGRSGKPRVWLDCGLLQAADVSDDTCLLLRAYHEAFAAAGVELVVAHACPELRQGLVGEGPHPALVEWLVDAFREA